MLYGKREQRSPMDVLKVVEGVLNQPPIPFKPESQTLKAWAMYCLRDRGFMVVYAQNADFAIESRDVGKIYLRVTENPEQVDGSVAWIVRDPTNQQIRVVPPAEDSPS